jgi:hypothetical protein
VPDPTLADLLAAFSRAKPTEVPTLRTVLRTIVLPFLGAPVDLNATPAASLYGVLDATHANWRPELAARLPRGSSYQKAYCRAIKRLVAFGEAAGLLHPDHHAISPAWRALVAQLADATAELPPADRRGLRAAFKRLARWATGAGLTPADIPVCRPDERAMASYHATFAPDRDSDFYRARRAWNLLAAAQGLPPWPGGRPGAITAWPQATWPPILHQGLTAIVSREGLGSWRAETRKGYAYRLASYLAVLEAIGVSVEDLVAGLDDPEDAIRLLFQGMPAGSPRLDARGTAARFLAEPAFRAETLAAMRAIAGTYDGRACERNPFLADAVTHYMEAGKVTTALNLVTKAIALNRGLLEVSDRHLAWLGRRKALLVQRARKQPSAYAAKKRTVFRHPHLWAELVRARSRLRVHGQALEDAWREARGERKEAARRRWAVALRNEVLFGLLLCYPLRVNNVVGMRLGVHYDAGQHHVRFEPGETKNEKEIDYELPEGGALGDLRGLVTLYLSEARPALLAGRKSDHVFVPDPRGGIRLREKALNAILADLSRRFLADVLPEGVSTLNPHLLRHATASYQLAVCQNLNLAAQLLNDSPATITQAYADVLACKKEATKRFLSGFTLDPPAPERR